MHRVLADGGVCVITSVMLLGIHAHPNDYWRFTPEGFRVLLDGFEGVDVAGVGDPAIPFFVFGIGGKGDDPGVRLGRLPSWPQAQRATSARSASSDRAVPLHDRAKSPARSAASCRACFASACGPRLGR